MSRNSTAVALLSAGLDSSVALALAKQQGYRISLALTFDYGQKAASKEIARASQLARLWDVPHKVVALPFFSQKSQSSLLKSSSQETVPTLRMEDLDNCAATQKSAKAVWVPNRNGVFIEIAACFAEQLEAEFIIVGFNREEAITFPDNSVDYRKALSRALFFSTSNHVQVIAPTEHFDKIEIVKTALSLNLPLNLIWSCYHEGNQMCGTCESCVRLKRALSKNEVTFHDFFANANF